MKQPPVKMNLTGQVSPPDDLHDAARKTLGSHYDQFIREYPSFTAKQLVHFSEKIKWH